MLRCVSTSLGADQTLQLYVTPEGSMLHTTECPHLSPAVVAGLVLASEEQIAELPQCSSCRSILDGGRRRRFETLDSAMQEFQSPLENRPRLREIAATLDFDDIWIPASQSYIALAGAGGVVAYFAKGYADLRSPAGGYDRELLPRHGAFGSRGAGGGPGEVVQPVCPTCFTQLPATGVCDMCS